ncbi:conserved hypothetical protein [Ricinus communis]|uniref:Uncharacterized protein n=1 Tax=Ricinus communis TaxID=3988 RepID=B9TEE4_RICCO|nr:conserved hypothetical protein [Ricinus communis]
MAAFVSHSDATGGEHAAPVIAAILATLASQNGFYALARNPVPGARLGTSAQAAGVLLVAGLPAD